MSRAHITLHCVLIGTILLTHFIGWAGTLAVGTSEANITLADSNRNFARCLDEAFAIAATDLALEHRAGNMACLASIWLFAFAAGATGHGLWVFDAHSTQLTAACEIRMWVHRAAVGAGLSHVCLLALASSLTLLSVNFTVAIAIARLTSLTQSWTCDGAVLATKA